MQTEAARTVLAENAIILTAASDTRCWDFLGVKCSFSGAEPIGCASFVGKLLRCARGEVLAVSESADPSARLTISLHDSSHGRSCASVY